MISFNKSDGLKNLLEDKEEDALLRRIGMALPQAQRWAGVVSCLRRLMRRWHQIGAACEQYVKKAGPNKEQYQNEWSAVVEKKAELEQLLALLEAVTNIIYEASAFVLCATCVTARKHPILLLIARPTDSPSPFTLSPFLRGSPGAREGRAEGPDVAAGPHQPAHHRPPARRAAHRHVVRCPRKVSAGV